MARVDVLQMLYSKDKTPLNFSFNDLRARPLLSLLSTQDVYELNKIATSIRLSSKPKEKYKLIDRILVPRGFKYVASGTNRVVYKYLDDSSICIKVALDKVGLSDNPNEYKNQYLLEPFVTKVFEVSPCGTVGLFERVNPITSREEYKIIADDVFYLITMLVGKYVLGDIGTNYFQNIGVRTGFGVVLLDFPYVYELDGNKLFCNAINRFGQICGGEIDYDDGFNKLICTKCGKEYFPKQLEKDKKEQRIYIKEEGDHNMSIVIKRGNEVYKELKDTKSSNTLPVIDSHKPSIVIKGKKKNKNNSKIQSTAPTKQYKSDKTDYTTDKMDTIKDSNSRIEEPNDNISVDNYKADIGQAYTDPNIINDNEDDSLDSNVVEVDRIQITSPKPENDTNYSEKDLSNINVSDKQAEDISDNY